VEAKSATTFGTALNITGSVICQTIIRTSELGFVNLWSSMRRNARDEFTYHLSVGRVTRGAQTVHEWVVKKTF
jgi:hypothetical protein